MGPTSCTEEPSGKNDLMLQPGSVGTSRPARPSAPARQQTAASRCCRDRARLTSRRACWPCARGAPPPTGPCASAIRCRSPLERLDSRPYAGSNRRFAWMPARVMRRRCHGLRSIGQRREQACRSRAAHCAFPSRREAPSGSLAEDRHGSPLALGTFSGPAVNHLSEPGVGDRCHLEQAKPDPHDQHENGKAEIDDATQAAGQCQTPCATVDSTTT